MNNTEYLGLLMFVGLSRATLRKKEHSIHILRYSRECFLKIYFNQKDHTLLMIIAQKQVFVGGRTFRLCCRFCLDDEDNAGRQR